VLRRLRAGTHLLEDDRSLVVLERDGWRAWVPAAPTQPLQVRLAPLERRPDLPSLSGCERTALASVLVDVFGAVERAWASPVPYLWWWVQRPTDGRGWSNAWLHLELSSPWRADGVLRHVAGGELGSGVMINPVPPEQQCRLLRGWT
jgi:UDPglucose--hexose-1-phosphate uridylyltransferase